MALIGADTDELREVGQEFQQGKETTDQVIMFLKALIAILRAASFFSGGASLAYAQYLESMVVPWLEKISQALGLFAKVLSARPRPRTPPATAAPSTTARCRATSRPHCPPR